MLRLSLLILVILYTPLAMLLSFAANAVSRRFEYAADAYAVKMCGDAPALDRALRQLAGDNLTNLTPHPVKVLLDYSHPPLRERLDALAIAAKPAS